MFTTDRLKLLVRWVIAGLEPNRNIRSLGLQVLLENCLLGTGAKNQNVVASFDSLCDRRKKRGVLRDMTRPDRVGMVVEMRGSEMRVDRAGIDTGQTHGEDFRRQVIDPDHRPPVRLAGLR